MYSKDHDASPINPLPPVVVALALAIAAVELSFQMGVRGLVGGPEAVGWRLLAVERFGFHDAAFDHMLSTGQVRPEWLWQLVSYPFIHYSLTHALFGVVILLALGNYASQLFSTACPVGGVLRLRGRGRGDLWAGGGRADGR